MSEEFETRVLSALDEIRGRLAELEYRAGVKPRPVFDSGEGPWRNGGTGNLSMGRVDLPEHVKREMARVGGVDARDGKVGFR